MQVIINGVAKSVSDKLNAQQLLQELGFTKQKLALEINHEVVPRSTLTEYIIQPGDSIEIIHAIGGG